MAIFDKNSIRLTPEEEEATKLPAEFGWREAGERYCEVQELVESTRESMRELTGNPAVAVQAMHELAVKQHRLCHLTSDLLDAMIARAQNQLELGGVITSYATYHQMQP